METATPTADTVPATEAPSDARRLQDWIPVRDLTQRYPATYPSEHSALWAVRVCRPELERHQALALIGGRLHVNVPRFEAAVIEAGRRLVQGRAA